MSIKTFFSGFLADIESKEKAALLPILQSAVASLAANPSKANLVAQAGLALAKAVIAEEQVGSALLQDLAADVAALAAPASTTSTPPVLKV
jgi:hypothetical protein